MTDMEKNIALQSFQQDLRSLRSTGRSATPLGGGKAVVSSSAAVGGSGAKGGSGDAGFKTTAQAQRFIPISL